MEQTIHPLASHIQAVKRRLIIIGVTVLSSLVLTFSFSNEMVAWLNRPFSNQLAFYGPTEALFASIKVSLLAAVILSLPVIFYQCWKFVEPALLPKEQRWAIPLFLLAGGLFALGLVFCNLVILPLSFLLGGAFLVLADAAARVVLSPAELPVGILTAFLGAPEVPVERMTKKGLRRFDARPENAPAFAGRGSRERGGRAASGLGGYRPAQQRLLDVEADPIAVDGGLWRPHWSLGQGELEGAAALRIEIEDHRAGDLGTGGLSRCRPGVLQRLGNMVVHRVGDDARIAREISRVPHHSR